MFDEKIDDDGNVTYPERPSMSVRLGSIGHTTLYATIGFPVFVLIFGQYVIGFPFALLCLPAFFLAYLTTLLGWKFKASKLEIPLPQCVFKMFGVELRHLDPSKLSLQNHLTLATAGPVANLIALIGLFVLFLLFNYFFLSLDPSEWSEDWKMIQAIVLFAQAIHVLMGLTPFTGHNGLRVMLLKSLIEHQDLVLAWKRVRTTVFIFDALLIIVTLIIALPLSIWFFLLLILHAVMLRSPKATEDFVKGIDL